MGSRSGRRSRASIRGHLHLGSRDDRPSVGDHRRLHCGGASRGRCDRRGERFAARPVRDRGCRIRRHHPRDRCAQLRGRSVAARQGRHRRLTPGSVTPCPVPGRVLPRGRTRPLTTPPNSAQRLHRTLRQDVTERHVRGRRRTRWHQHRTANAQQRAQLIPPGAPPLTAIIWPVT